MLKARETDQDGTTFYIFGLDAGNIARMIAGDPIVFHGGVLGLATVWFHLTYAEPVMVNGVMRWQRYMPKDMPDMNAHERMVTVHITPDMVKLLQMQAVIVQGGPLKLPGHIKLVYAPTQQMLLDYYGFTDVPLPENPTETLVFDPVTGALTKVKSDGTN